MILERLLLTCIIYCFLICVFINSLFLLILDYLSIEIIWSLKGELIRSAFLQTKQVFVARVQDRLL